jgi:hypothetical protein
MFYVLQNESTAARRRVPILLTDAATGTTAQTGVATTNIYVYINMNGGAFIGGTGNKGEAGFGQYYYEFQANEVATLGLSGIHITATGCRDYDAITQIAAFNMYGAAGSGISAGDVWSYDISGISTAGTAGSQLNLSATGGAGISAYDVWNFTNSYTGNATELDLTNAAQSAASADNNANLAATQTANIAFTVWGEDIGTGGLSPFGAGTAGTILYTLGQAGVALTAGDVWDYAGGRTITGGIADTVTLVTSPVDVSYPSMAGLANTIWSTDVSGFTSPSAGYDLTQAAVGSGISAYDVWDFSITGFGGTNSAAVYVTDTNFVAGNIQTYVSTQTPQDVWTYAGIEGRTITGGLADTVTTLTNPANITTSSMSGVANTVWSTLTAPYTTHATFGHQVLRSDNAATIGEVTLHQSGGSKRVDADVHAFVNNTASATAMLNILTGIGASITSNITGNLSGSVGSVTADVNVSTASMTGIANTTWSTDVSSYTSPSAGFDLANASSGAGLTAGDVWSYASRTITGGIADTVTDVTNGVIVTTNNDKTGYSLSSTQTFDLTGNVSGSVGSVTADVNVSTSSMSGIADTVWNYATRTLTSTGAGISAYDVWNFDPTAMTVPQAGAILTDIQTDTNTIITDIGNIPNNVWASDVSGYLTPGEAGYELTQAALGGGGVTAGDVWTYASRTITGGIADTVTTLTNRSGFAITGGTVDTVTNGVTVSTNNDKTGYALSSTQTFDLTGNITGNLSGSVGSVTNPVTFESAQYAAIASSVWNAATRTLTSTGAGISAFDVWNFVLSDSNTAEVDLVQAAAGSGLTAGDVWSYATRTITGGIADTVTTLTDRSGFAITGGTITTVSDKTGYSLSSTQSFNLTGNITGNLSGSVGSVTSGVTVTTNNDKTGYALSGAGVSAVQSGLSTLTQAQVGTEVDSSLSDVGLTSTVTGRIDAAVSSRLASASYVTPPTTAAIWSYSPRTLTSGAGATAGDVWTYNISAITNSGTAGKQLNDAAVSGSVVQIINGPYRLTSTAEGSDGRLDILQDTVQTIELQLIDVFGSPINISGNYTLSVDVYDESGALTVSYTPTVAYAGGGLINFDLDTDVTGVLGRYTIVVSLTDGDVIQVGPLQVLVRPL